MTNINIVKTNNNTWVVKADSERFGKQEIMFESYNRKDCVEYASQFGYVDTVASTKEVGSKKTLKQQVIDSLAKYNITVESIMFRKKVEALGVPTYIFAVETYDKRDLHYIPKSNAIQRWNLVYYPNTGEFENVDRW